MMLSRINTPPSVQANSTCSLPTTGCPSSDGGAPQPAVHTCGSCPFCHKPQPGLGRAVGAALDGALPTKKHRHEPTVPLGWVSGFPGMASNLILAGKSSPQGTGSVPALPCHADWAGRRQGGDPGPTAGREQPPEHPHRIDLLPTADTGWISHSLSPPWPQQGKIGKHSHSLPCLKPE